MKTKLAIVDCRIDSECKRSLELHGFYVITLPAYTPLPAALASHTDMLLCPLGSELISTADYADTAEATFSDIRRALGSSGIKLSYTSDTLTDKYPDDCRLNVISFGNNLLCRTESVSGYIKDAAMRHGMNIVPVRQGYPACVTLKLSDGAAITADRGIKRVLRAIGVDVTLIENGDIDLPPYEYGFIGGCAGVYGKNIYFLGDPATHRSYTAIHAACDDAGLSVIPLGRGRLRDLGGILFAEGDIE